MYKNCCDLCSCSPIALYITKKVREKWCCSCLFPFGGGLVILFLFICPFSLPFICTLFLYKLGCRKTDAVLFGIKLFLMLWTTKDLPFSLYFNQHWILPSHYQLAFLLDYTMVHLETLFKLSWGLWHLQ